MNAITLRPIPHPIDRTVTLPGSKSLTNRALLAAAMAAGVSEIRDLLLADDTRLMIDALRSLGISIRIHDDRPRATVHGCGGHWPHVQADLACGNAGTVIRFLTAACAAGHGNYRLDGSARMRERPIGPLVDALRDLGAAVGFEMKDGFCPLTIHASGLRGGTVHIDKPPSSQFVSALLMAAPRAATDVMIDVTGPLPSAPYVRLTLDVMHAFGVDVVENDMRRFIVPSAQTYAPAQYDIEPDASAASYFFAAAALTGGRVTVNGLGRTSHQGDIAFVNVLRKMGCRIDQTDRSTTVHGPADGRLQGIDVDLNDMPDVVQTLAVLAAFAHGPTTIRNVANLRIKETDRLDALATELARIGVQARLTDDGITIHPGPPPRPATIETYDDHRMAMSFALAGLRLDGLTIKNPDCVTKTFPNFFQLWTALAD